MALVWNSGRCMAISLSDAHRSCTSHTPTLPQVFLDRSSSQVVVAVSLSTLLHVSLPLFTNDSDVCSDQSGGVVRRIPS